VLTNSAIVQAIAVVSGQPNSAVASASFVSSTVLGNGTGLIGQYYTNTLYTNPFVGTPLVRTDPTINFNWNTVSPDPTIPTTDYTVRWTGMVQPMFTGNYTFYTTTDDGVRLWVNGQELVNRWSPQSPTTWNGSITLQALQVYPIEMDYFQAGGGAIAQLAWSGPYTTQALIPQSQLYPFSGPLPVQIIASQMSGSAFSLQMSGTPGKSYVLQASTNLTSWISLSTNVPSTTVLNFSDLNVSNYPARFYRAVQLP
jgi:PA14 domain